MLFGIVKFNRAEDKMAVPTVATHMIDALAEAGVTSIYGVVGDSLNSLTEAVRKHPDINWIGA